MRKYSQITNQYFSCQTVIESLMQFKAGLEKLHMQSLSQIRLSQNKMAHLLVLMFSLLNHILEFKRRILF